MFTGENGVGVLIGVVAGGLDDGRGVFTEIVVGVL